MRRRNHALLVCVVAVVTGVALAAPLAAQGRQVDLQIVNRDGARSIALGEVQTLGADHGRIARSMSPAPTCSECVWLDTYNPNNTYNTSVAGSNFINEVKTSSSLLLRESYLITITGTVSYWGADVWSGSMVGAPEQPPMFSSPGQSLAQTWVGLDWEYMFAYPNDSHGLLFATPPIHAVFQGISLDNGNTYFDLTPVGGQTYSSGHSYQFLVEGQGKPAVFHTSDFGPHNDNYGRYEICVYHLVKQVCD